MNLFTRKRRTLTLAAAETACPTGWRLPSRNEWGDLAKAAGGTSDYGVYGTAGKKLKSTSGWNAYNDVSGNGTDDFGFSALPGGYRGYRSSDGYFLNAGDYGYWWTATEFDGDNAYYRRMYYDFDSMNEDDYGKGLALSVRCIAD